MQVRRVVTSFIESDGSILILKRSGKVGSYQGRWAGVSGYLESGETTLSRALQEIKEETGLSKETIRLIREGELLATYDHIFDTLWVVQPYLFTAESRDVRLDWEHVEHRWIKPEELVNYLTVPRLDDTLGRVLSAPYPLTADSELIGLIQRIEDDHEHGASWLAEEAVKAFKAASERFTAGTRSDLLRHLKNVGRAIIKTRPSMAPILNNVAYLLYRLVEAAEKEEDPDTLRKMMLAECDRLLETRRNAFRKTVEEGVKLLSDHAVLLTYSYSSTMLEVLKRGSDQGKNLEVWVAESRPLFEGRRLAQELVKQGISATLIADAAVGHFMGGVNMVMLGADSVLADGSIVNKVGTYLTALAAMEKRVPFYVICESHKFNPMSYVEPNVQLEEKDASELLERRTASSLKARNLYFDITPAKLAKAIITEDGVVKPCDVKTRVLGMFKQLYFP